METKTQADVRMEKFRVASAAARKLIDCLFEEIDEAINFGEPLEGQAGQQDQSRPNLANPVGIFN